MEISFWSCMVGDIKVCILDRLSIENSAFEWILDRNLINFPSQNAQKLS